MKKLSSQFDWIRSGRVFSWFFKMIGEAKTVAREKDAFIKFVQSVKLPNAS